ncbi:type II toxin-antitoxin system death-on-curing family toxin [Microbacterium invictum]|uniref:Type II toxin-antitoxin system death-on-curing family toxin n=1 Tax=Microbacterium invictum TaxID=515415 RepID=A0ABZ0VAE2_9MICO|nr:type II toxin-antitoxin system death-on-curing family toxin [Microbacterium invictum]WQB70296.1 type II toxin-antitoxin system death-on-curing family toxin [Microbacterium invictum]
MTVYLRLDDALQVVDTFGFHVRDAGLLASALARPAAAMFGEDAYADLDAKGAALLESVLRNHSLADGNKRTGWTLLVVFWWLNGFRHSFSEDEAFDLVLGVAEGRIDLAESTRRLAAHRIAHQA